MAETISKRVTLSGGSVALVNGGTYTCPTVTDGKGGAVSNDGGTVTGANVTFFGNAAPSGGAVYKKNGSITFSGESVSFADNTVSSYGGAIQSNGGSISFTCDSVSFTGNTANGSSGAIYNQGSTITIAGNANFAGNRCSNGNSGALCNTTNGTVSFTGDSVSFTGNSAKGNAGAIFANSGSISFTGASVSFSGNTAGSNGGAIYTAGGTFSGAINFSGSSVTFSGNSAASGGAIYNGGTVTLNSATFTGNTATGDGGAIYNDNGGTVTLKGAVTLASASDEIYNKGTLNWDLTGGTDSYGSVVNYQYLNNDGGMLTITAATQPIGNYVIATGDFTDFANKDTFIVKTAEDSTGAAVKIKGAAVGYGKLFYSLTIDDNNTPTDPSDDKLILNAEDRGTILEVTKAAGYGPVDDFLVYSREACPLGGVDRGSVFASAFFGGTVSVGSGLLASPTIAL